MSCIDCRHFKKPEDENSNLAQGQEGHCLRYPPKLDPNYHNADEHSILEDACFWVFPIVSYYSECGEFDRDIFSA